MRDWRGVARCMIVAAGLLQVWPLPHASANPPPAGAADATTIFPPTSFLTQRETWAPPPAGGVMAELRDAAVLVFGLTLSLLALLVMRHRTPPPEDIIRLSAMILIVTGTLFLVTAGYSAEQIAPALGLLGAVAGYMLGRADRKLCDHSGASKRETDAKDS